MSEELEVEKPKKRRVNGKAKGSGFENVIVKRLTKLLPPLEFRRSQSSGAILGGKNAKNLGKFSDEIKALFVGDVTPTNELDVLKAESWKFRFTIECKFYKSIDNLQHLVSGSKIWSWFDQAAADAAKLGKEPILIFKFNHTDIFAAVDAKTVLPDEVSVIIQIDTKSPLRSFKIVRLEELEKSPNWWKINENR